VQFLVDHQGKDANLGGTAVVQLDGELLVDGLLVPSGGLELSAEDCLYGKVGQSSKSSLTAEEAVVTRWPRMAS
jgi:hypothetical protein